MGISVFGTNKKAVLYNNTTGVAFGPIYRGKHNAEKELKDFVNNWKISDVRAYNDDQLNSLMIAYKVDMGFADRSDWVGHVKKSEEILNVNIE